MPAIDIYPANALSDVEQLRPALETAIRHPFTKEVFADELKTAKRMTF